jgi:hypothetical protein
MLLCGTILLAAQTTTQDQSSGGIQHHSKKVKDEVTVRGCVGRLSTDHILIQPDEGNSYKLEESQKVNSSFRRLKTTCPLPACAEKFAFGTNETWVFEL